MYTVLLSAVGIAIFVFGTLLRRRREYITLRALGMGMRDLISLVVGEAALVAVASVVLGGIIGTAMALLFVQILRPLFTIPPSGVTVPAVGVTLLMGLVLAAALALRCWPGHLCDAPTSWTCCARSDAHVVVVRWG